MKRLVFLLLLPLVVAGCGVDVPRPPEDALKAQLAVLVNRAENSENQSWDNEVVSRQIVAPLPRGKATALGWMLEWTPEDGALAYAIIPWSLLSMSDPGIKAELPYSGGVPPGKSVVAQITAVVKDQLPSPLVDVVAIHSVRLHGKYAAFSVTPLLPMADDGYGFAKNVAGVWEVIDLGSSDVGCGLLPNNIEKSFQLRCSS